MNYIPLSVKTHYELLSSLIKVNDLTLFCVENNIKSVGITDTNMFGTMEIYNAFKLNNINLILGVPFEVENLKMTLYAKNYEGYVDLLNLVSIRNINNLNIDDLKKHSNNVICVTDDYSNYLLYKELYNLVYLKYNNFNNKKEALLYTDKIVYINDSYYINENDKEYLIYLKLIKDGKTIEDIDNYNFNNSLNKDIDELDAKTTFEFADLISITFPDFKFKLPEYAPNKVELLEYLCNKGLNKRLNGKVSDKYISRLKMELEVINSMNFTDYFLIVYDFILYAKKHDIVVGPGRGSAAGSLVSYTLGITEIDPLKFDLIFERFLNKDRVTLPDIDVDIESSRRDELINYVKQKYGIDKVANIITFGTLLPKQVIRDVGRVLKINSNKIESLTKTIRMQESFKDLENNNYFLKEYQNDEELTKLVRISKKLENIKRHVSVHAAGIIISDEPLMNKVPLYKNSNEILTGYTMEYLESIGLLKIDFLANINIATIKDILKLIEKNNQLKININKIPLNDKKTLDIFYHAYTNGIFQFESEGMKSFLKSLKIKTFDDLVLAIALYRPGPRDNIPEFIKVREGKKKNNYIINELESIISDTNGIIVYQEQILEILKKIGGFSYSEADIIRRAMSKKKEEIILKYRNDFTKGALKNNITIENANKIYDLILKFANYGFNKSHSVAYSLVAYQMAFLKAHFPEYFMITLLNTCIGNETKTKEYIDEAKIMNIEFDYLNINYSTKEYILVNNKLMYPLNIIKNIGKEAVNSIVESRSDGLFTSFIDFVKRSYNSKVNSGVIENLIYSGALDTFKINRKTMIENLPVLIEYSNLCKEIDESLVLVPEIIETQEYSEKELLDKEYKVLGFYIKNHPVSKYKKDNMCPLDNIEKYFDKTINTIGLIETIKEINTKNNEKMAFLTISDELSKTTLVVFPKIYEKVYPLNVGNIIIINAKVEKRLSEYQLIANNIEIVKRDIN